MATEVQEVSFYKDGEFYTHENGAFVTNVRLWDSTSSNVISDDEMQPILEAVKAGKSIVCVANSFYYTYLCSLIDGNALTTVSLQDVRIPNIKINTWRKENDGWAVDSGDKSENGFIKGNAVYYIPYAVWNNSTAFTQSDVDDTLDAIRSGQILMMEGVNVNTVYGQCMATSTNSNMLTLVMAYPSTGTLFRLAYAIYNKTSGSWVKTYKTVDFNDLLVG